MRFDTLTSGPCALPDSPLVMPKQQLERNHRSLREWAGLLTNRISVSLRHYGRNTA